jgi:hypothetical protein
VLINDTVSAEKIIHTVQCDEKLIIISERVKAMKVGMACLKILSGNLPGGQRKPRTILVGMEYNPV